jgi:hypothetical protein
MMSRERWGAFSVIDHTHPTTLTPDVLLYDRLVFPFPARDFERKRWEDEGWQPERLDRLIQMLGDLAISANWTAQDQLKWELKWDDLCRRLQFDAEQIVNEARQDLAYYATRMVLAQKSYPMPRGIDGVDVVAAWRSELEFLTKFGYECPEVSQYVPDLGLKLSQRIAVPSSQRDPLAVLGSAVQLARDGEFRVKRNKVHELQNQLLSATAPSLETVRELEQATEELVEFTSLMLRPVRFTNAFAVAAMQPGYAVGQPFRNYKSPYVTLSALQFRPRLPDQPPPNRAFGPAAMYRE